MAYLSHHGIKGQKWGVKNGPPYPIVDKGVIKKGTVLSTVTSEFRDPSKAHRGEFGGRISSKLEQDNKLSLFDPRNKNDDMIYKGLVAQWNMEETGALQTVHTYELTRDLKVATDKDRLDAFKELYKENKKEIIKEIKPTLNKRILKTDEDFEKAFCEFVGGEDATNRWKDSLRNSNSDEDNLGYKYLKKLGERADISLDYSKKNIIEFSERPLMLLNGLGYTNDALKHIGSYTLTEKEAKKNLDTYVKRAREENAKKYAYLKEEEERVRKELNDPYFHI